MMKLINPTCGNNDIPILIFSYSAIHPIFIIFHYSLFLTYNFNILFISVYFKANIQFLFIQSENQYFFVSMNLYSNINRSYWWQSIEIKSNTFFKVFSLFLCSLSFSALSLSFSLLSLSLSLFLLALSSFIVIIFLVNKISPPFLAHSFLILAVLSFLRRSLNFPLLLLSCFLFQALSFCFFFLFSSVECLSLQSLFSPVWLTFLFLSFTHSVFAFNLSLPFLISSLSLFFLSCISLSLSPSLSLSLSLSLSSFPSFYIFFYISGHCAL